MKAIKYLFMGALMTVFSGSAMAQTSVKDAVNAIKTNMAAPTIGPMLDWIKDGMKVDYHVIAEKMHRTMEGNVVNSIRNFQKNK